MKWPSAIEKIRRNHALEHATIHILSQRCPRAQLIGHSDADGFVIYGHVPTEIVAATASEALARLQAGERDLAVHPRCGTNLAMGALLTGATSFLVMKSSAKRKMSNLPGVLLATTLALMAAQPLGLKVQELITTSANLDTALIADVKRYILRGLTVHRVFVHHE
ncbi:MAG: hypothetical protein H5T64_09090 [Chloroflexi bacterium]|nr:hypothetical protein [Chloroflexota bacterium]